MRLCPLQAAARHADAQVAARGQRLAAQLGLGTAAAAARAGGGAAGARAGLYRGDLRVWRSCSGLGYAFALTVLLCQGLMRFTSA